MLPQERVKTTLATTASVEARLPVQAQQILRQVSQGWISPQVVQNSLQSEQNSENRAEGKWHLKPPDLVSKPDISPELVGPGLEQGWDARRLPSMLPSLCPGDRLLHEEGAAVLRAVPELGWADGRWSPSLQRDSLGLGAPMDAAWEPPWMLHASPLLSSKMPPSKLGVGLCLVSTSCSS